MAGRTTRRTTKGAAPAAPAPTAAAPTGFGAAAPVTAPPAGFAPAPVAGGFGAAAAPAVPPAGVAAAPTGFGAVTPQAAPPTAGFGAPMAAAVQAAHTPAAAPATDPALASAVTEVLAGQAKLEKQLTAQAATLKDLLSKIGQLVEAGKAKSPAASAPTPAAPVAPSAPTPAAPAAPAPAAAAPTDVSAQLAQAVQHVRETATAYYNGTPGAVGLTCSDPKTVILMAQVMSTSGIEAVAGDPNDAGYQANVVALLQQAGAFDANGVLMGA